MGQKVVNCVALLLAAVLAGCGGGETGTLGTGGSAGNGTTASTGSDTTSSGSAGTGGTMTMTTMVTSATVGGSSGAGGAAFNCDPPADPDSLFAQSDTALDETVVSMCKYRGDVLLIVNVAEA